MNNKNFGVSSEPLKSLLNITYITKTKSIKLIKFRLTDVLNANRIIKKKLENKKNLSKVIPPTGVDIDKKNKGIVIMKPFTNTLYAKNLNNLFLL